MQTNQNTTSKVSGLNRRDFLHAATAAAVAAPFVSRGQVLGANDRLGVGFIGVGGRGRSHVNIVKKHIQAGEKLQIVAISDTYGYRLDSALKVAGSGKKYPQYRDLLADKEVDVVCIASPDRLHVPQALAAIHAGKDVYCEKPMGHWSQAALSRQFYKETQQLKRVVQVGNQGNSSNAWKKAAELIKKGAIGTPQHVDAGYYRNGDWGERMPIPDKTATPGPDLDWEGFLGDAPKVPFTVDRFFSWRKYLDYAGGPCTDLFPHVLTPFISLLGVKYPALATGSGGIYKYTTYDREVPDTFNMSLEYPEKISINLVCTLANNYQTEPAIRGDEGTLTLQNPQFETGFDTITLIPAKGDRQVIPGEKGDSTFAHWKNFLDCVRSRAKPVSDVEFGYKVQVALCMSMLSYLHKKIAQFNFEKEEIVL